MAIVKFTQALKRFYPNLDDLEVTSKDVNELLQKIEQQFPGIKTYLVDEQGRLRKHVNIFKDGALINDRDNLSDPLDQDSEIYIMQALSGG